MLIKMRMMMKSSLITSEKGRRLNRIKLSEIWMGQSWVNWQRTGVLRCHMGKRTVFKKAISQRDNRMLPPLHMSNPTKLTTCFPTIIKLISNYKTTKAKALPWITANTQKQKKKTRPTRRSKEPRTKPPAESNPAKPRLRRSYLLLRSSKKIIDLNESFC